MKCPDPRFNASFIHTSYKRLDNGSSLKVYPDATCIKVIDGAAVFPYYRKYLDPTFDVNSGCADFYLMRFAEMYLISAEAAARLSGGEGDQYWQTALARIETLHSRARKSTDGAEAAFPTWKDRTFSGKDELVNAIIWERSYEMCGEGHDRAKVMSVCSSTTMSVRRSRLRSRTLGRASSVPSRPRQRQYITRK